MAVINAQSQGLALDYSYMLKRLITAPLPALLCKSKSWCYWPVQILCILLVLFLADDFLNPAIWSLAGRCNLHVCGWLCCKARLCACCWQSLRVLWLVTLHSWVWFDLLCLGLFPPIGKWLVPLYSTWFEQTPCKSLRLRMQTVTAQTLLPLLLLKVHH